MMTINDSHEADKLFPIIEADFGEILSRVDIGKAKGKKILITGANGFLGQYITGVLSQANRELGLGCTIHAIGLSAPKILLKSLLCRDRNILYRRVDLSRSFDLAGYDYIFHAAGYGQPARFIKDPASTVAINVNATRRLLEASPRATFVFFSAGAVYGDISFRHAPVREDFNGNVPLHELGSVYVESKRLGEALCAAYREDIGVNVKIVRIFHTYGPGLPPDDRRVMSEFIKKALVNKKITLLDDGRSVKVYGYIADVVAMILFVAFHGRDWVYNVGGRDSISILDLAKKIAKICKVRYAVPATASRLTHVGRGPVVTRVSISKIKKEMKNFAFTPFSEGLLRTVEWSRAVASRPIK